MRSNASHRQKRDAGPASGPASGRELRLRMLGVIVGVSLAFTAVSAQLIRLSLKGGDELTIARAEPVAKSFSRPDIIDRNGRLLATDVALYSFFADPAMVLDRDEFVEKLATVLPDIDSAGLRASLADPKSRFVWVRRAVSPLLAQQLHDLGLPGLERKKEMRRAYPMAGLAGHIIGSVNIDNKGVAGLERTIDERIGVEGVHGEALSAAGPVRLTLDLGVQHSLEDELATAEKRFGAKAALGLVMDIETGAVMASASLPAIEPGRPADAANPEKFDRVAGGTFELGSIFKMVTLAMALDSGTRASKVIDVTRPLAAGRFKIADDHPAGRPLSLAEIFTRSSNVGAAMLAIEAGAARQRAFMGKLGLLERMDTERGPVKPPLLPETWGRIEQMTMAYGHGIAVAPLQFAAAAAAMLNGGLKVTPRYLKASVDAGHSPERILSAPASAAMRALMRLNVTDPHGTGRRADVPGYEVGGKTGTAEIATKAGYAEKRVLSSFVAAFPMSRPKYLVMVTLFEPHGTAETDGEITAGTNAAPTAGRIIARIAPQLGLLPTASVAGLATE